jgi:hypothetical protein
MAGGVPIRGPGSLQGRGSECALLDDVIAALRAGESRTLLMHGEAGIGKTALLNYAVASAADMRCLQTVEPLAQRRGLAIERAEALGVDGDPYTGTMRLAGRSGPVTARPGARKEVGREAAPSRRGVWW